MAKQPKAKMAPSSGAGTGGGGGGGGGGAGKPAGKIRWGILTTGNIAKKFAGGASRAKSAVLTAVGSRDLAKAQAFAKEFNIPTAHGSYEALLADKNVDAVYIATPHPLHAEWAIKAADAGKHILCEKPITLNHADTMTVIEAARRNNVFLMEAFMYRCNPQTKKLVELVREKAIGEVRMIRASFSFHAGFNADSRLFANKLGGGGIMDVGCYPVSVARLIAGVALGKPFADPIDVKAIGVLGKSNVDEYTAALLKFPGDILAQVSTGVALNQESVVTVYGTTGRIEVPQPWFCTGREGGSSKIIVHKYGEKAPQEIEVSTDQWLYEIEANTVAEFLADRQAASPAMSWDDTLGNMRTLDQWREQIGLVYDGEKPEAYALPLSRQPLAVRAGSKMKYGRIEGIDKKISRLVMGMDNQRTIAHATAMFDDFFERGGTTFDTAFIYGGGRPEVLFGQWVKNRNLREQIVLIGKGAHTPFCNPTDLTKQLVTSLERLQMDYVDIYCMHRDNPDIPVGEFIDVLNEHVSAGRMKVFGGSNWSIARVDEANVWARKHGKQGFSVVSNNFSLARMVDPVWGGCISASDKASREWLRKNKIALMPWSSQARGFFIPERAAPDKKEDAELVRCWYADDNFERQKRAVELAKKKGVAPINIALAYVLCQPFETFPLIGPRLISETVSSFPALGVELTPAELAWLNLEA
ncbi:MAG: aldo/keto reductase [Planctomycetota bacterium]